MKKTCLANTNPYFKSRDRHLLAARSTITSCGVEGIKTDLTSALGITIQRRPKRIYNRL